METNIFYIVGRVVIFIFAGMGISTIILWSINKFIVYCLRSLGIWTLFVDFAFDYKLFKQWKKNKADNIS